MLLRTASPRIRYYRRYTLQYIKEHLPTLLLGGGYLFGIWTGSHLSSGIPQELSEKLLVMLDKFLLTRSGQPINNTLFSSFFSAFGLLLIIFLFGFCAVAGPVLCLFPFLKGLGFGLTAAAIIERYGGRGVAYCGLLMVPGAIISGLVFISFCKDALIMSKQLFDTIHGELPTDGVGVPRYILRFLVFVAATALGAALEGILFSIFSGFFTF